MPGNSFNSLKKDARAAQAKSKWQMLLEQALVKTAANEASRIKRYGDKKPHVDRSAIRRKSRKS